MKKVTIFDKVRDKLEPILEIEDLELKFYHPNVLSKEISLEIFDGQIRIDFLNDKLIEASNQLDELRNTKKLDDKNLQKRHEITKQIDGLNTEVRNEIARYIESLAKIKPGRLMVLIAEFYKKNPEFDYPVDNFISDIFKEVTEALSDYRMKELDIKEDDDLKK
jgi:hypothetical protein